jgi:hypothetical protein
MILCKSKDSFESNEGKKIARIRRVYGLEKNNEKTVAG